MLKHKFPWVDSRCYGQLQVDELCELLWAPPGFPGSSPLAPGPDVHSWSPGVLCHTAGLSYLTDVPASVPLGRNTGQDFVMLEFSQELDSLHPPGQPV